MSKYFYFMIFSTACALVMAAPDVGNIALMVTLGLAFPFFFAATGVLYGLCAAPLVLAWNEGGVDRAAGALVTAGLVAIVAFVPSFIGRRNADAAAKAFLAADHVTIEPKRPSTIEIRGLADGYGWPARETCGIECHQLLKSGQAQWIRFVETKTDYRRTSTTSTFHRALHGKDCAVPGTSQDDKAACVVVATDPGDAADLVVEFMTPPPEAEAARRPWRFWSIVSQRVIVAQTRSAGHVSEVMRETEVLAETVGRPTLVAPVGERMHSGGTDFLREAYKINPLTFAGVLTRLGYSLQPADDTPPTFESVRSKRETPIDAAMTREMISVLDLPGDAPFDGNQMATIFTWIEHARNVRVWTPDLVAVLRRVVRDRRVRRPTFFTGTFVSRPDVAAALMPDILDMIETDGIGRDYTPAREAAYTFDKLDERLLRPHADRIVALLDRSPEVRAILLPAIGRIGVDPLPYLTPIRADRTNPSQYSMYPRVIGACRADTRWANELIGALRGAYLEDTGTRQDDTYYRSLLLKA